MTEEDIKLEHSLDFGAVSDDFSHQILVRIVYPTTPFDYDSISDEALISALREEMAETHEEITDLTVSHRPHPKFRLIEARLAASDMTVLHCYVILKDRMADLGIFSELVEDAEEYREELMDGILDTLKIEGAAAEGSAYSSGQNLESGKQGPFEYQEEETWLTFTVSSGWESIDLPETTLPLRAAISCTADPSKKLYFGVDTSIFRSHFKNGEESSDSSVTELFMPYDPAEISAHFPELEADFRKVTIGEETYFTGVSKASELGFSTPAVAWVHVDLGCWYLFLYSGTENDPHYAEVYSIIKSTEYPSLTQLILGDHASDFEGDASRAPEPTPLPPISSKPEEEAEPSPEPQVQSERERTPLPVIFIVCVLFLLLAIGLLCLVLFKLLKKNKKPAFPPMAPPIFIPQKPGNMPPPGPIPPPPGSIPPPSGPQNRQPPDTRER